MMWLKTEGERPPRLLNFSRLLGSRDSLEISLERTRSWDEASPSAGWWHPTDALRGSAGELASRTCCWKYSCPQGPPGGICAPTRCDTAGTHCLHNHRKLKGSSVSAQIFRAYGKSAAQVVPWPFIKTFFFLKKEIKKATWLKVLNMPVAWLHRQDIKSPSKRQPQRVH